MGTAVHGGDLDFCTCRPVIKPLTDHALREYIAKLESELDFARKELATRER
ncbi:unnamed protein product, partial [marine sediment metagenome]